MDPPTPPAATSSPSTALHVLWRDDGAPVRAPVALVVDVPGGPVDRVVADPDVTTFLNDRFHPVFHPSDPVEPIGTIRFYSADGCALTGPLRPRTPTELIAVANDVIVRPEARDRAAPFLTRTCPH